MKLKKINAALGLLSILFLLLHAGYIIISYLLFLNPVLKYVFSIPFIVLVCLHAVCGMMILFMRRGEGVADPYPQLNRSTVLQRLSAALILPLVILHINTFRLLGAAAERGLTFFIILLLAAEILFFAVVLTHVAMSLTKGLITLGLLTSEKKKKALDIVIYVIGAVVFIVAVFAVIKGQAAIFLAG